LSQKAIWSRGFRPFFLGAILFAVFAMADWMTVYLLHLPLDLNGVSIFQWHAHEMVFGYTMAVIAGFLLTAAWNWTGKETASGTPLAVLFLLWMLARLCMISGTGLLAYAAAADLLFMLGLGIAVIRPVIKVRQKRQVPIILMIALMTLANLCFYLGAAGFMEQGVRIGVYGGLYLALGMVLFMGRRVIPFFTERGVGYEVQLRNDKWNDIASIILYPLFVVSEVFLPFHLIGALLAGGLFISNSLRVMGWHTLGVWQKPLLWSLFTAFIMINLGFLLRAMMAVTTIPDLLPVHAFAVGGIGIITVGMMARVTLGHTGRNVHQSPPVMTLLLAGMVLTTIIRIFLPLANPAWYRVWIGAAGITWIICFALFALVFSPMLWRPRADEN
jgi:uncharacterized protein involved in response to NO